jgi:lipopolysaccharide export system permease protein
MRLHDRYFFRELLTPLAFCLGGFLVFWISFFFFNEMSEMQDRQLRLFEIGEYALATLPGFFVVALPITLLLSLLYALTQHSRYQEITALRAAGVSLWRLCAPYFVIGLLATGFYFFLNEIVTPFCDNWSEQILTRHVQKPGDFVAQTKFSKTGFRSAHGTRLWQIGEYNSLTTEMINPNVTWTLPDGSWRALKADRAVHTNGVWIFFGAQLFLQANPQANLTPDFSTNEIVLPEFTETPKQILREIKFSNAQGFLGTRSADISLRELWPYLRQNPDLTGSEAHRLWTKFYGRLAAPWICLVVVLIAIPFGAAPGRRNLFFGVAGSIFIGFTYFVTQAIFFALGTNGILPALIAAWLPNLFFAAVGIFLTLRIK